MLLVPMVPEQTVGGAHIVALLTCTWYLMTTRMIVEGSLGNNGPSKPQRSTDILHTLVHLFMMNLEQFGT